MTAPGPAAASRIVQSPDCAYQCVEGEMLIVHPRDRQLHLLNETGSALWNWIETPKSPEELVGLLCGEFEVGPDEARADVLGFLETLRAKGLVRPAE